ncbi:glycosyltransferase family 4 protein [Paenibacillus gorillae]|uniref:glycosyltransferase family 4 protein n=1 Tax=Paenibacillus gorillae TaxID=1243662 RepID=UPI0004B5E810|nr:glycosyltransferase family 4 protein [Paenibacillus gorillae]
MRILIACSWSLPHAGGVNTYINQLVKGLQRAGHLVDIFSPTPDGQGYYIPGKELMIDKSKLKPLIADQAVRSLDQQLPGADPWIIESEIERYCLEAAAAYCGLAEYDLIHAQDIVSAHAMSRVKPPNTPLVTTIHGCLTREWFVRLKTLGLTDQTTSSPLWHYSALREYLGATVSDITISPSQWLKRVLIEDFNVPEESLLVSHYGIDIEQFQQQMMRDSAIVKPAAEKVFICPARFDVVKGHTHLIHALAKLKAERADWVCWLVGDGALREDMMQLTDQLGLKDHIVFMGNRNDIPELIRLADFIVLPSMQDNQPFAIIEAQIAGKPVISSNAGGIPEMVTHLWNGLVFHAGDIDQLHACLKTALDDAPLLSSMANQAKAYGERHWSLSAMTSRVVDLYELARSKHPVQAIEPAPEIQQEKQEAVKVIPRRRRTKWRNARRKRRSAVTGARRRKFRKRRFARKRK